MVDLCQSNLKLISPGITVPGYSRRGAERWIVHIGVGGFHRAHQAVYLDDLLQEDAKWGICGVGLLPQDRAMRDALVPQDCLYTVVEASGDQLRARVVGSLIEYLLAPDDREAVIARMAAPECPIVSLTVTEGGYRVNPDDANGWAGCVAEALDRRRQTGIPPFTVMSCDNLQHNGEAAKNAVLTVAERRDAGLARWLRDHGAFPNSMVDRITPVTTDEHRRMLAREFGIRDAWPVVTEPFRQWIIEDRFSCRRPAWKRAGALMTADVLPYEKMKIRLLNGSHQALCYLGLLLGYEYVHEAIRDEHIAHMIRTMMDVEISPLLPQVPGIDLAEYKATLIERFNNEAIGDKLSRIATDSHVRMREFLLPSLAEQVERGGPRRMLSLAVAGWLRYLNEPGEAMGEVLPALRSLEERGPRETLAAYQQE